MERTQKAVVAAVPGEVPDDLDQYGVSDRLQALMSLFFIETGKAALLHWFEFSGWLEEHRFSI